MGCGWEDIVTGGQLPDVVETLEGSGVDQSFDIVRESDVTMDGVPDDSLQGPARHRPPNHWFPASHAAR